MAFTTVIYIGFTMPLFWGVFGDECLPTLGNAGNYQSIDVRIETWQTTSNIQDPYPSDPERLSVREEHVLIGTGVSGSDVKLSFFGNQICVAETIFEDRKSSGPKSSCFQRCLNPGDHIRITYSVIDSGSIMPGSNPPCCLSTTTMYHEIYVQDFSTSTTPAPALTCIDDSGDAQQKDWKTSTCQEGDRCFLITSVPDEGDAEFYKGGCEKYLKYESTDRPHRAGYGAHCPHADDKQSGCVYDAKIFDTAGEYDFRWYAKYCIRCCSGNSCNNPLATPGNGDKPSTHGSANMGVIVAIVISIGFVIACGLTCFFCIRRSKRTPLLNSGEQQVA